MPELWTDAPYDAQPASAPGSTRTGLTMACTAASGRSAASIRPAAVPTVCVGSGPQTPMSDDALCWPPPSCLGRIVAPSAGLAQCHCSQGRECKMAQEA
jgi:hypothetical protein